MDEATRVQDMRKNPAALLALMWHQHQPLYKDVSLPSPRGSYLQSTVRRHAHRDYYSMSAMVAEHPAVRLTINLTPSLVSQIEDYATGGATDRALELTLIPAEQLSPSERARVQKLLAFPYYAYSTTGSRLLVWLQAVRSALAVSG